ncbi:SpoVT-AbrB domain-containing protein [Candidatus Electronema halotolerans]|jgi:hypothetical protein
MYAIEFSTRIKNGVIEIPERYRRKIQSSTVKVILLKEDAVEAASDMIDRLLKSPLKIPDFKPLTREEIYDRG